MSHTIQELLSPAVLVLIVEVTKGTSDHFVDCNATEEWWDCDDCVDAYNKAHDQVMAVLDTHAVKVRADQISDDVESIGQIIPSWEPGRDDKDRGYADGLTAAMEILEKKL